MTATEKTPHPDLINKERLIADCREAIRAVDRSLELHPRLLQERAREAKRAVVRVRDDLIETLRAARSPAEREPIGRLLDDANVVLSLLIGVEYPAAGVQRNIVAQARDRLRALVEEKLTGAEPV